MMDEGDHDRFGSTGILRMTSWATAAAVALTVAALASMSPGGSERMGAAVAALGGGNRQPVQVAARRSDLETDRRSLNEALRLLASDRDRLMTRVASLERNLDDITGSIKTQSARPMPESTSMQNQRDLESLPAITGTRAAKPDDLPDWLANVPQPWPSPSAAMEFSPGPSPNTPAPSVRVSALPDAQATAPTMVSRTEFGVDIGSGSDLDELRMLWNAAKARHGRLFGNLRPIAVRREDRAGTPDYRLVVGPLSNAGAAAKLCATLGAADVMCSTRPYQGERLMP
jgi:hypothetical protein